MRRLYGLLVFGAVALFAPVAEAQEKKTLESERKDAFGDLLPLGAIARIGTTAYSLQDPRDGHALSPDGKWLATLSAQDGIHVWEIPGWTKNPAFKVEKFNRFAQDQFVYLAFTPDGKTLVTREFSRSEILFIDRATGKTIKKLTPPKHSFSRHQQVVVSADNKTLVLSGMHSNTGRYEFFAIDLATEKAKHSFSTMFQRVVVAPNCLWFASSANKGSSSEGSEKYVIEIGDLTTGKSRTIPTDRLLGRLAFSAEGKWLAASDGGSTLRLYEVSSGAELHNIRLRPAPVYHLAFAPDDKSLYVIDGAGKITRWDPVKGERIATHEMPSGVTVSHLAFTPDGKVIALGRQTSALLFWDVTTGKVLSRSGGPTGPIREARFSPQGELFVADEDQGAWWNPRTGAKKRDQELENPGIKLTPRRIELANERRPPVFLAPNGEFLATTDDKGMLYMFDVKTGVLLYQQNIRQSSDGIFGFFDDGRKSSVYLNGTVRLWDTATGRDIAKCDLPLPNTFRNYGRAISPDGKYFAMITFKEEKMAFVSRDFGKLLLWDVERKTFIRDWLYQDQVYRMGFIAFSPDSQWLAVDVEGAADHRLQLTRVAQPKKDYLIRLANKNAVVSAMTFSPDGRQFAYAQSRAWNSKQSEIYICEMATKKIRQNLVGHATGSVSRLAYSPDSTLLASGATDTTVLVWNGGLRAFAQAPTTEMATAKQLDAWYAEIANADAKQSFLAMIKLAQRPVQTVHLLEQTIPPVPKLDLEGRTVAQWIEDIASNQFAVRCKATTMLQKLGASVEPDLRPALPKAKDVETKRRIEGLLDHIATAEWTPAEIRHARAVEIVEAIGTPEARVLLTRWNTGDSGAVLTVEARRALARWIK